MRLLFFVLFLAFLSSCSSDRLALLPERVDFDSVHVRQNEIDTSGQRILFIGDSMVAGLMYRLQSFCEANNHEQKPVIWYSSSTKWFGESDTIAYFIGEYKPTFVLITLGANELFISNIEKERQVFMDHIMDQLDTIPFAWVGPPNWKDDTGINGMIEKNVGSDRFFLSKGLDFKRLSDGAHPTRASSDMWMDSIANWLMNKSDARIVMNIPKREFQTRPNKFVTVLQPPKDDWAIELKRRSRIDSIRRAKKMRRDSLNNLADSL